MFDAAVPPELLDRKNQEVVFESSLVRKCPSVLNRDALYFNYNPEPEPEGDITFNQVFFSKKAGLDSTAQTVF